MSGPRENSLQRASAPAAPHGRTTPDLPRNDPSDDDPRRLQVHRDQPARDVPYVPSDDQVVAAMLKLAEVNEEDVLYDLGCGDGRIVIAAARRFGTRGVGIDIDLQRIHESIENKKRYGVGDKVSFRRESFFDTDLSPASVVTMYLLPGINVKLRPKLLFELRPGTRVISNNFPMGNWPADQTITVQHRTLYKWIVPAWVQGEWKCIVNRPKRRWRMQLSLRRHFQIVTGTARIDGREVQICDGHIDGDRLSFTLWHPLHIRPPVRYVARVRGNTIRGTCVSQGAVENGWCAVRA